MDDWVSDEIQIQIQILTNTNTNINKRPTNPVHVDKEQTAEERIG